MIQLLLKRKMAQSALDKDAYTAEDQARHFMLLGKGWLWYHERNATAIKENFYFFVDDD